MEQKILSEVFVGGDHVRFFEAISLAVAENAIWSESFLETFSQLVSSMPCLFVFDGGYGVDV